MARRKRTGTRKTGGEPQPDVVSATATARIGSTIIAAFALSGLAGLMHQVVWAKLLNTLIGTTAHAQAAVLSVFMGGLALGAVYIGRRSDRLGRPLRIYVALEFSIALYCVSLPLLVGAVSSTYFALASGYLDSPQITFLIRFALAITCVLIPAVLMGGTLPVLARHVIGNTDETRSKVGRLYAANSFGAVLGAGVSGFITLPLLGVTASLGIAAALNLLAGALLWPAMKREERLEQAKEGALPDTDSATAAQAAYTPIQIRAALAALALSGFAAMGYEVLFARVIALGIGSSTYSFSVMLMAFIFGISLGSALISRLNIQRPLFTLALSQLAVVVALLAATPLIARLPYWIGLLRMDLAGQSFGFAWFQLGKAGLCLVVLLAPTICLGVGFPLVAQIQARGADEVGGNVGTTYSWSTLGNVIGTIATGLILVPWLGLLGAFHVNFGMNLLAALLILAVLREPVRQRAWPVAAVGLAVACYAILGSGWLEPLQLARNHLRMYERPGPRVSAEERAKHPSSSFRAWKDTFVARHEHTRKMLFEEDAYGAALAIDLGSEAFLFVNTKADASTVGDLPSQLLIAHAPLFLNPDASSVLVIGHGSGITLGSALQHPVSRVDVVEISRAVLAMDPIFEDWNYHALRDPRVTVYLEDAQAFLRTVPKQYDVIISEPTNPWIAGVSGLFTLEYFEALRSRLSSGGVAAVWFQQYKMSDATAMMIVRTLHAAFPYVSLWRSPNYKDVIAVASAEPLENDFEAMERRFDRPQIRNDLARMGVSNLATYLLHNAVGPEGMVELIEPGPLNTVDHPRLEYNAPRDFFHLEHADFVRATDPLQRGGSDLTDISFDRYLAWRREIGDPLGFEELEYAARTSSARLVASLHGRVPGKGQTGAKRTRPARGGLAPTGEMQIYEAAYWGIRLGNEGRLAEAAAYIQRARSLMNQRGANPATE